ncbi:hypothetical protein BOTBODRAFT_36251 [Botryobasidium botryosum FD-172 SS1]|uniref:Histone deacetylase 8 n=1 Tax=Botryobasidium botryosum (strain FD-172 SS1) TaxID=930990 RepID=A0A067M4A2_BOTB1|nr:hypothetical protein BOTBODRAFT_36251 [Botryobasidium botryosum FD-172 SS1]
MKDLLAYHDRGYIEYIIQSSKSVSDEQLVSSSSDSDIAFGLEDDCPPFPGLPRYVQLVAGASLTGAGVLREGHADVAIVWDGGRHHAQKDRASGFCYVADCILAILHLKRASPRPRIMYIDLDLHFSDAVSHAFASSPSVLTLSIHHTSPGFFPASPMALLTPGDTNDLSSLSLPLQAGASSPTFARVWKLVEGVKDTFKPDYVVVQCGVDGLAGDPCAVWNWELDIGVEGSMGWCVEKVLGWECKTLLLGGGGYNSPNVARAWAYLTSIACGSPLPLDMTIPDHQGFPEYGPSFTLDVPRGNMQDTNKEEYLQEIEASFEMLIRRLGERV